MVKKRMVGVQCFGIMEISMKVTIKMTREKEMELMSILMEIIMKEIERKIKNMVLATLDGLMVTIILDNEHLILGPVMAKILG